MRRRVEWFTPGVELGKVSLGMKRPLQEGCGGGAPARKRRVALHLAAKAKTCVSTQVREHAGRLTRDVYVEGAFNYSVVAKWALAARGIDMGQGTTDVEALNGEFIWLYRSHGIKRCKLRLWTMVAEMFFMRVLWRRAHAHMMPTFAHGDHIVAQDLVTSRAVLAFLKERCPVELAREWEKFLAEKWVPRGG